MSEGLKMVSYNVWGNRTMSREKTIGKRFPLGLYIYEFSHELSFHKLHHEICVVNVTILE